MCIGLSRHLIGDGQGVIFLYIEHGLEEFDTREGRLSVQAKTRATEIGIVESQICLYERLYA